MNRLNSDLLQGLKKEKIQFLQMSFERKLQHIKSYIELNRGISVLEQKKIVDKVTNHYKQSLNRDLLEISDRQKLVNRRLHRPSMRGFWTMEDQTYKIIAYQKSDVKIKRIGIPSKYTRFTVPIDELNDFKTALKKTDLKIYYQSLN